MVHKHSLFSISLPVLLFVSLIIVILTGSGFPGGSDGKESACSVGDPGLIPGLGRSPAEGNGNPLQYLPGKPQGWQSLAGYRPLGHKELDTVEQTCPV